MVFWNDKGLPAMLEKSLVPGSVSCWAGEGHCWPLHPNSSPSVSVACWPVVACLQEKRITLVRRSSSVFFCSLVMKMQ